MFLYCPTQIHAYSIKLNRKCKAKCSSLCCVYFGLNFFAFSFSSQMKMVMDSTEVMSKFASHCNWIIRNNSPMVSRNEYGTRENCSVRVELLVFGKWKCLNLANFSLVFLFKLEILLTNITNCSFSLAVTRCQAEYFNCWHAHWQKN